MSTLALLGATGFTGGILAQVLADRGHELVFIGRDRAALDALARRHPDAARGVRTCDLDVPGAVAALATATAGVDAVVSAVGGDLEVVHRIREMAVHAGRPLVDTAADVRGLGRAFADLDAEARAAGLPVVPGVGWRTAPGDLLAAVAATKVVRPREVHSAYVVPDRGGAGAASSHGLRHEFAAQLAVRAPALAGGRRIDELPGEVRRLAWFPRPIGPHHAAGIPGLEPLTVPRHVAGVRTVRTYLAVSSLRAEVLQGAANLSRWERTRPAVVRWFARGTPGSGPDVERRAATRWACVVEVVGSGPGREEFGSGPGREEFGSGPGREEFGSGAGREDMGEEGGLVRGWMNGRDPHGTTALLVAVIVESLLDGQASSGVVPPAMAGVASVLLDAVAATSSTRWAVTRIEPVVDRAGSASRGGSPPVT